MTTHMAAISILYNFTQCKTDGSQTCSTCPELTPFWTGSECVACDETVPVVQTAVFARGTLKYDKELVAELGPYKCPYDVYVKGHIDDTFLITDVDENELCRGGETTHTYDISDTIYRLLPGEKIKIWAVDNHGTYLSWELYDTQGGNSGTPQAPVMELRRTQSTESYCNIK